jgi:hypothetical protein
MGALQMLISDAQRDIDRAYVGGGPGITFSGLIWLAAAYTQSGHGTGVAFLVLFAGGMAIYPAGLLLSRYVFRRTAEAKDNPLGMTVLESTVCMIGGLFAAWLMLPLKPTYVFPLAAIAVGTHFAVFKTVYGNRLFWLLGAVVTGIGVYGIFGAAPAPAVVYGVAATEIVFGAILTVRATIKR